MRKQILRDDLYDLYIVKKIPAKKIGEIYGRSSFAMFYWLRKFNIPIRPRGGGLKKDDLTGRRFGKYVVVEQLPSDNSYNTRWKCKCDCGNESIVDRPALIRNSALSCGKCEKRYNWKGYGEISGCYFTHIKHGANRRKLECPITIQDIWNLFLKQNRKCALTGIELTFVSDYMFKGKLQTASLDRIDSCKGYTLDNIQWVHKDINFMKQGKSDEYFIKMCNAVSNYNCSQNKSTIV